MSEINAISDPPAAPQPQSTFNLKESLEVASKTIISLVGLCYVLGLVVRNIHLGQYGYYTVSLLELNYILAGLWSLLPIVFGALMVNLLSTYIRLDDKQRLALGLPKLARTILQKAFNVVSGLMVMIAILLFGMNNLGLPMSWKLLGITLLGLVILMLAAVSIRLFVESGARDIGTSIFIGTLAMVVLSFYLVLFAKYFYKDIPSGIGGGRPEVVRLVVADDSKPQLLRSGIRFANAESMSEPTELILATGTEYVLRDSGSPNTIVLPRDAIKALIFEKR